MLTPDQYIKQSTHEYPTLCFYKDYKRSAMRCFDQLFNVIGNGIRDDIELHDELNHPFDENVDYKKYFSKEDLYEGYTKMDVRYSNILERPYPNFDSNIPGAYTKEEQRLHPEVAHWEVLDSRPEVAFYPYPNFKEDYSIIYNSDFKKLGVEWIDAAIWFYKECDLYFKGNCSNYHNAYPKETEVLTTNADEDLKNYLSRYKPNATNEEISEAYGAEYTGDIQQFQRNRWAKEHARIQAFLTKTLSYLENMKLELVNDKNAVTEWTPVDSQP